MSMFASTIKNLHFRWCGYNLYIKPKSLSLTILIKAVKHRLSSYHAK